MKKWKLYTFSFLCFTLFVLSQSRPFMEWWADYRVEKLHIPFTRYKYGDLYSGCYLPQFMDTAHKKLREYKATRNPIDLYVLHDSYLENKIKKENFIGVNKLVVSNLSGDGIKIELDRKKKNILIIECSERTADWRITDTTLSYPKLLVGKQKVKVKTNKEEGESFIKYLFNPFINYNLEFNLYDYEIFRPIKEAKARMNFAFFERLPKDITTSTNKKYLLLNETVDIWRNESSFRPLSDANIAHIVWLMNNIKIHYTNLGFDEVYFSIIPNPVSVVDWWRMNYNYKISRIKNTPWRQAGFIDVFDVFRNSTRPVYRRDDSHWNSYGLQLWVDQVNANFLTY